MPHLHLSSLVTKKKIETGVIFFHSTSRLCTYPYLAHLLYIIKCVPHCPVHTPPSAPPPTAHLSIPPQHPIRRTSRQERQARQQNTPRLSMRPTSCRPRAATGVINGAPTTRRHQDNPAGRNHRRTQHAPRRPPTSTTCGQPPRRHQTKRRGAIYDARRPAGRNHRRTQHLAAAHPTPATARAADILPPTGGSGRHKWRPYDTQMPREPGRAKPQTNPTCPRRPAQHPRLSMRPTSCRLRAAAGVINGAPTTRKCQENPAGRNRRRT